MANKTSMRIVGVLGLFLLLLGSGPVGAEEKDGKEKKFLIIGHSSLAEANPSHQDPVSQAQVPELHQHFNITVGAKIITKVRAEK